LKIKQYCIYYKNFTHFELKDNNFNINMLKENDDHLGFSPCRFDWADEMNSDDENSSHESTQSKVSCPVVDIKKSSKMTTSMTSSSKNMSASVNIDPSMTSREVLKKLVNCVNCIGPKRRAVHSDNKLFRTAGTCCGWCADPQNTTGGHGKMCENLCVYCACVRGKNPDCSECNWRPKP